MTKNFNEVEEVLSDEDFLDWYFLKDPESRERWENWLSANPGHQPLVNEAMAFMKSVPRESKKISSAQIERELASLRTRLDKSSANAPVVSINRRRQWWVAAAAILVISVGFAIWKSVQPSQKLEAGYAEICDKQLPDGSKMLLNANSQATMNGTWEAGKDREIWLKGEAYFKVARTPARSRFVVHTSNMDVIVTGTQFNVSDRDDRTTVLLQEGSVTIVTRNGKELNLVPGDYVEISGEHIEKRTAKEDDVLAWKENKIAFDDTPLSQAGRTISHHYGVPVRFENKELEKKSITGILPNNKLEDLLNAIEMAVDVKITRTADSIVISGNQ